MTITQANIKTLLNLTGETFAWNTYTITNTSTAYASISTYTSTATTITGKRRAVLAAEIEKTEGFYTSGDEWLYISGSYGISVDDDFTIGGVKRKIIDHVQHNFAGTVVLDKFLVRRIDQ